MSHFKDGRKLIWGILLFTQPCNCLKSQNEGITWIIQNATFLLNPRTIRYLNLIFLHTTLSVPIWKEFNFLYFLCNTHPWTYFLRSKIESMTVRYAQIVDKAFTETDHQCNARIFTFRKLQKCSLLCILLWSHWNVACCYRTSCTVSTILPAFQARNELSMATPPISQIALNWVTLVQCIQQMWNTPQTPCRDHKYRFYLN